MSSLRLKLAAALAAALGLLILAGAGLMLLILRTELKQAAGDQLLSVARQAAGQMDGDLGDTAALVQAMARAAPREALADRQALGRYMDRLPVPAGAVERCVALDPDGQALAQQPVEPAPDSRLVSDHDYFRAAVQTRSPAFSRPFVEGSGGRPAIMVAAPRLDGEGRVALVLSCRIGLLDMGAFGYARGVRIAESGHVLVVAPERLLVVHPDSARLTGKPLAPGESPIADLAEAGSEGVFETRNVEGRPVLVGIRKVERTGWSAVAVSFVEEAHRPLREARDKVVAIALAMLVASFALAAFLAGMTVAPIERLTRHLGLLRARSEARPLPVRDDEIGRLARAFNELLEELHEREAGLRFSEEKFYKAFHSNPDFTLISRLGDGRIVEVNEGFEKLLGISAKEAVGKMSIADLHMWADPDARERFVRLLGAEGSVRAFPAVFLRRGGERREVEIDATTIDLAGEPHIIGTARDVTDLRRSEEKFAKAFYANPAYATVSRLEDGKFVAVNEGFERLTGWKAAEVLGRTALDIGLWADPAEREVLIRELRDHGAWRNFHSRFRTRDGDVRLVEGSCVLTEIGGEQQIIGVARDITEVARAEEALRQSEEKFAKVFHASPDGILVARLEDGLVLDLNESYERLLGYSRDESVGRTTAELGVWARPEQRGAFIEEVKRRGSVSGYEFALRHRDGRLRDVVTSTVIIDIAGTPCLISIVRDISDQRRAEEDIRNINVALEHRVKERTAELEAALRELESFSYSVSHDLRSPLRAIAGYARVIEEDYAAQIGAEGKAQLERIVSNAIRMGEIIDDLLDFARIGRAELKRAPIDMAGLAREVLAEQPEAGAGRRIDVRIGDMPRAMADRSLVRQVWSNLLSNALKYTRQREEAFIEAGGIVEYGEAHYYVRDNGAGFDMAYANKLFHVFQRLHRDSAFEGTGVGLATVARIVQRHGGRVWAEGVPDQGATFHFTLPAA